MPVGIENESGKIIWTVFGMKPYISIIASALVKRCIIKAGRTFKINHGEGKMMKHMHRRFEA